MSDFNNRNRRDGLSSGEVFVAVNLLSKIGVVFVIASVIAFSAASEGHIPNGIRMALVPFVGVLMLAAGELFYRKDSRVFANALIYGGAAELFICVPIGMYGLHVFNGMGALAMAIAAAAVGVLLTVRYKSQGPLIVTLAGSVMPMFTVDSEGAFLALTVYLAAVHCAAAIIARKKSYVPAIYSGIALAGMETVYVLVMEGMSYLDDYVNVPEGIIAMVFAACCALCYSSGALLNAAEDDGEIEANDLAFFCITQGGLVFFALTVFSYKIMSGIVLLVLALLYTIAAVAFSLKCWMGCKINNVLINFAIACAEVSIFFLIRAGNLEYIALHSFAAAILIAGCFLERELFKRWGYALLIVAELRFFIVLAVSGVHPESYKISAAVVDLILWFGIMAAIGTREKVRDTLLFRIYSFAALMNAGILGSNLILSDLMRGLNSSGIISEMSERALFSGLLCAAVWMILGFVGGKLPHLKGLRSAASITHYAIGFTFLAWANMSNALGNMRDRELGLIVVIATIVVNIASVLAVLDITIQISEKASKFSRAVGLIVSGYAMLTLTTLLGTNNLVRFTSCIISIIYLVMAAAWIVIGFRKSNALLRRFGLALALFSSAKLFLFDFRGVDAFGRTILFIGFGITLLGISFAYAVMEKRLSQRKK